MTSEGEAQKTIEFLRRRKLRLQQVREQSKDIAKKIRLRAKVENLKQVVELDEKKARDFIQSQEKVVKKLEELYSRGLDNVGSSHKLAHRVTQEDTSVKKPDLSHLRGREAAAELKRQKQQKLDELKKSLDRKIQAREAANVLSREKSATTANKLSTKPSTTKCKDDEAIKTAVEDFTGDHVTNDKDITTEIARNDMGTQWDSDLLQPEWQPAVPALAIPQDDSVKGSVGDSANNPDKQKRPNLFALSDEMPSSLRGGTRHPCDTGPSKQSSTLVSEYIQNRAMRLRESDVTNASKKHSEDLKNLRQTISRSKPLKPEGSAFSNICHVVEGQLLPVPMWHAESNCQCQSPRLSHHKQSPVRKSFANVTHSDIDKIFSSIRPVKPNSSSPVSKKTRPFIPHKCLGHCKLSGNPVSDAFLRGKGTDNLLSKKKSVTMYNHSTRDARDWPRSGEPLVRRHCHSERDAYSQALSETASASNHDKQKKNQHSINKIAVTKQNVEKEYEDTIAFLSSLPKNKNSRPVPPNTAFKDDHRIQAQRENRQRILQQEFRNIERESRRLGSPTRKVQPKLPDRSQAKRSKSPSDLNAESNFNDRDFQYSWMPIPESDSKLAVHTIPTGVRAGRADRGAGAVKFSRVDSYHEYRSRHKHTPPTRDTAGPDAKPKRLPQTVIFQNDDDTSATSTPSDNSFTEGPQFNTKQNITTYDNNARKQLTDAERIIIYKILSCKHKKNSHDVPQGNLHSNATESEKTSKSSSEGVVSEPAEHKEHTSGTASANPLSSDNLKEGIYEVAGNAEFSYNVLNCYPANVEPWQSISDRKHWWDNLESMYYTELEKKDSNKNEKCDKRKPGCCSHRTDAGGDNQKSRKKCSSLKCKSHTKESQPADEVSTSTSKKPAAEVAVGPAPEAGFVKLVDDGGKQEGNFYIGATGFLKDDAYEVIIQLRKKDTLKEIQKKDEEKETVTEKGTIDAETGNSNNAKKLVSLSEEHVQPKEFEKHVPPNMSEEHIQSKESEEYVQPNVASYDSEISPVVTDPQGFTIDTGPVTDTNISTANASKSNEQLCPSSAIRDEVPLPKMTHDRSVSTSFRDTHPLSEAIPKSDPITATSTYTQTTLGSPNPRPVYIHMSSSTSTAYMSPPEMILPNYFKRGHEACRKVHRSPRNIDKHEERNLINQERHCKKHASSIFKKIVTESKLGRLKSDTARSSDGDVVCGTYNVYKVKRESTLSSPVSNMTNNRCSKCKARVDSRMYCRHHSHKSKHQLLTSKPSMSIWNSKSAGLHSKKSRTNTRGSKFSNKSYLSPIIKEYIQKLLSLNREEINTIQILNQDCSSVNTPTSSIINLPTNVTNKTSQRPNLHSVNDDFSWEHIKDVLKQHALLNNYFCHPDPITTAENEIPGKTKLRKRNSKKKILHKVKSLNISKKIAIKPCDASTNTKVSIGAKQQPFSSVRSKDSQSTDHIGTHGDVDDRTDILKHKNQHVNVEHSAGQPKIAISSGNSSSNSNDVFSNRNSFGQQPINTSTQTNCTVDGEINFIKLAEGKLQNMEKIADLTEKCTKRLSNLAKVLEEVRKNKSLAYSQLSTPDSTSDSDRKSDNVVASEIADLKLHPNVNTSKISRDDYNIDSTDYESLLSGAPKPGTDCPEIKPSENMSPNYISTNLTSDLATPVDDCRVRNNTKFRNKPPPALLRINLRHPQEHVVPHELSTVIEVDSPLSVKFKTQTSTTNTNQSTKFNKETKKDGICNDELQINPEVLKPEIILSIDTKSKDDKAKAISTDSSDDPKLQMMDLNQFNEIMLRPFISLQEYAHDYYKGNMNTKRDCTSKDNALTDDISSLHSDGSLPDVVAELLKRKLITEPFRFDTASNVNSTSLSSESTVSVLALSKVRNDRKKSKLTENKENIVETSDSLSISSNPDLENAFKKLGLGWASSTLKKTKERLALSSTSNTSSSSLSHIKFKNATKQDVLVTDSVSSVPNLSKKPDLKRHLDSSKNAEQQTSFTNSMTVKEFLTKELANKITFTDKSDRNDTNQEFVSLFETKQPEELKSPQILPGDSSGGSAPSGNNRARTSTPVNLFKSVTYHSSSSSNMSNGLFSNADDLSSVKLTSTSMRNQSTSEKDELTIPNCSLKMRKGLSDGSKTDSC